MLLANRHLASFDYFGAVHRQSIIQEGGLARAYVARVRASQCVEDAVIGDVLQGSGRLAVLQRMLAVR